MIVQTVANNRETEKFTTEEYNKCQTNTPNDFVEDASYVEMIANQSGRSREKSER
jgi:hypothetical protein